MCTITAGFTPEASSRFRVVFNRDELRSRGRALPPEIQYKKGEAVGAFPVDRDQKGTWIGINRNGLIFTLLNYNPAPLVKEDGTPLPLPFPIPEKPVSRGGIIPSLLETGEIEEVIQKVEKFPLPSTLPFRLVAMDGQTELVCLWDRKRIRWITSRLGPGRIVFHTSSGMGDRVVEKSRGELWNSLLIQNPVGFSREKQDRFHRSIQKERPALGVVMDRPDAKTVSRTVIEMEEGRAKILYEDLYDEEAPETRIEFPLAPEGSRKWH